MLVYHIEHKGGGSAEFIVCYLQCVEIINSLILTGVAAVGEALTDSFKGFLLFRKEGKAKRENESPFLFG